jgi:hypothetical protein
MLELFIRMMLGHFVGDYLLQNQWMATRKSQKGWPGHFACTIHVALYTLAVALFIGWHPLMLTVIAVPHWVIDRWSLAIYWLRLKNGYWMKHTWSKAPLCAAPASDALEQNVWKVAFAAPVYIMNDNTAHFVCLWLTALYLR